MARAGVQSTRKGHPAEKRAEGARCRGLVGLTQKIGNLDHSVFRGTTNYAIECAFMVFCRQYYLYIIESDNRPKWRLVVDSINILYSNKYDAKTMIGDTKTAIAIVNIADHFSYVTHHL